MDVLAKVTMGMTAEKTVTVTSEMTVGHFVADMPQVYATPMMVFSAVMPVVTSLRASMSSSFSIL